MNNIVSNIEKYGDRAHEIKIKTIYDIEKAGISIKNRITVPNQYVQGTGIGIENIRLMMGNMKGSVEVNMSEKEYCIILWFPVEFQSVSKKCFDMT